MLTLSTLFLSKSLILTSLSRCKSSERWFFKRRQAQSLKNRRRNFRWAQRKMVGELESKVRLNRPFEEQEKIRTSLMAKSKDRLAIMQSRRALPSHQARTSHLLIHLDYQPRKNHQNILIRLVVKLVMILDLDLRMQMTRNKAIQN